MSDDQHFQINRMAGINKFQGARTRAFLNEMIGHLRGKPVELLSFEDIRERLRLREESYRGLQEVPLDQIAGSVGRYQDFTRNFLPRRNRMQDRWSRVYAAANSMLGLPPIELYKIGDVYFVRDGNHRVSVARQLGAISIEAHVTELPTAIPLHPDISEEELDDATAYAAFLAETGLSYTRHHHQSLQLSERTRYTDLMGHIYLHKAFLSHQEQRDVSTEDAAAHWYDNVYRPAVTLIRKYNMTELMGVRTEADLYLWLVDHLRGIRERYGDDAASRKISDALADFMNERKIEVPGDLLEEDDNSLILTKTQILKAIQPDGDEPDEGDNQNGSGR